MVERRELIQVLSHATVFVCPSVYEPFGLVNLEAMACEAAVVASDVGGIPEIVVEGETGFLVPCDPEAVAADPEAAARFEATLAERINRLVGDPALAARLGAAGRQRVLDHFTWERVAERTLEVYREVLAAPAAGDRGLAAHPAAEAGPADQAARGLVRLVPRRRGEHGGDRGGEPAATATLPVRTAQGPPGTLDRLGVVPRPQVALVRRLGHPEPDQRDDLGVADRRREGGRAVLIADHDRGRPGRGGAGQALDEDHRGGRQVLVADHDGAAQVGGAPVRHSTSTTVAA